MFKVMKFSRCGAVLALMLVAALAIGITSAIFIPRAAPAAADNRVTLVIDAGHGGIDGGAVSAAGVKESEINLAIARRLNSLAELYGVRTHMTRVDDSSKSATEGYSEHEDLVRRVEEINSAPNGILISIHQNCYPDRKPSGAQVLYAASDGSEALGTQIHDNLVAYLDPQNRRVAAPISEKIYLMREVKCPAVLVECGFLSNAEEAARLCEADYQRKLAVTVAAGFLAGLAGGQAAA